MLRNYVSEPVINTTNDYRCHWITCDNGSLRKVSNLIRFLRPCSGCHAFYFPSLVVLYGITLFLGRGALVAMAWHWPYETGPDVTEKSSTKWSTTQCALNLACSLVEPSAVSFQLPAALTLSLSLRHSPSINQAIQQ